MERHKDVERLNCAGFLTEFYIINSSNNTLEAYKWADYYKQGWMGWLYKGFPGAVFYK